VTRKANDFYYLDGDRCYPSVTAILEAVAKPALITWGAKMGVRAALIDPTISEEDAGYVLYKVKGDASVRGRVIHQYAEHYGTPTATKKEELEESVRGFATAWDTFHATWKPKILERELLVVSNEYFYAGTLDIIAQVNNKKMLLDIKTGKAIYDTYPLQLAAYKQALKEMGLEVDATAIVLLKEDGSYEFAEVSGDFEVFLAAKKLWLYQNDNKFKTRQTKIEKKGGK
jgi:hypothetical protein